MSYAGKLTHMHPVSPCNSGPVLNRLLVSDLVILTYMEILLERPPLPALLRQTSCVLDIYFSVQNTFQRMREYCIHLGWIWFQLVNERRIRYEAHDRYLFSVSFPSGEEEKPTDDDNVIL